jgi:hypothetical protein
MADWTPAHSPQGCVFAYEHVQEGDTDNVEPHNHDIYQRMTSAHTIELDDQAAAVTERLVAPLLRRLVIDRPPVSSVREVSGPPAASGDDPRLGDLASRWP